MQSGDCIIHFFVISVEANSHNGAGTLKNLVRFFSASKILKITGVFGKIGRMQQPTFLRFRKKRGRNIIKMTEILL